MVNIFCCLLLLSTSVFAAPITIYRWVDSNNIVHFSQQPPEIDDYITINMQPRSASSQKRLAASLALTAEKEQRQRELSMLEKQNKERCQEAKKNLTTLTEHKQVKVIDEKGKQHILTKQEMQAQVILNEKQILLYCQ